MIEIYRSIVPANYLINDNHGQHYKVHQGNLSWLTSQFNRTLKGEEKTPGNFVMPSIEFVQNQSKDIIDIRCEIWRCTNIRFDPQNYAKTFKAPLDLLVYNKYIKDDCWKFVNGITYCGGGSEVWKDRAFRYKEDGLPDEITPEWWNLYSNSYNDIFIRILIK